MATDEEGAGGQEALISSDSRRSGQEEKRLRVFGDAKLTRPDDLKDVRQRCDAAEHATSVEEKNPHKKWRQ